jgi:hypothetical protein
VNRGGSQKNYREGSIQLPELRLPELASWYERVAAPSVLVRSQRCSRTPPRPHGSINNNEKEEEPHGIDPAKAGSLAFRYSVTFIARLTKFQTTPPPLGLSSFLCLFFRDCGCGKAMSFDDYFRRDRPSKTLRQ